MIEADAPSTRSTGFDNFGQLQKAHVDLMAALKPDQNLVGPESDIKPRIREFVEKCKNAGLVLGDESERRAAQNILDYWSAETVSVSDINAQDWTPEKLLPFDPSMGGGKTSVQSDDLVAEKNRARKRIQLAATARLWKDSGRAPGYLLNGAALEQAASLANDDRDVMDLVAASRDAVRTSQRNTSLISAGIVIVAILCMVIAWLLVDKAATRRELDSQRSLRIADRSAQSNEAQVAALQAKIKALIAQLKAANLPVPSEISETVPDAVVSGAQQGRSPSQAGNTTPSPLRGYVWIGSDAAPNLTDTAGAALVKPSSAVVGTSYKMVRNLVLRTAMPSADYIQGDSAGVVPEQTTVTLKGAPVGYRRPTPASILATKTPGAPAASPTTLQYWAPVEVQYSDQPIVYMEFAGTNASGTAQSLAQKLKNSGFRVPGVEQSDLAKGFNEIRYYNAGDKAAADKLAAAVNSALQEMRVTGIQSLKVSDLTAQKGARNFPGVLELWIDLSQVKPSPN